MERIVEMTPAFDKRNPDPSKNYGIHGVNLRMILKGEQGAVQFVLFTNWQLPHVTEEQRHKMSPGKAFLFEPMAADLGYHSKVPLYEGQKSIDKSCPYCDGAECFYDGSTLNAEPVYEILLREGSDGVWKYLEKYYHKMLPSPPTIKDKPKEYERH